MNNARRQRPTRGATLLPVAQGNIARLAYAHARKARIATDPLLRAAGLTHAQIEHANATIGVRAQITFLNLVAAALKDDLLGFHLAQSPDLREFGLLYYVMASSDTLLDALRRVVRYTSIVNEGVSQHCGVAGAIEVSFRYVGVSRHVDRHQIEFWMTALLRTCRQITGLDVEPVGVRLVHPRAQPERTELADFFGPHIEFAAATDALRLPARLKAAPLHGADPYLNNLLRGYCEDAVAHRQRLRGSFVARAENAIAPLLPHGKASGRQIARELAVSERTLARRLADEGTSFSDVLDRLRSDLASRYLADADLGISQIAWLLGYDHPSTFSRAFRRWTGRAPRDLRQQSGPVSR